MKKLTKKLSVLAFTGIFFVVIAITFAITGIKANAQYDSGYDSRYGSSYDSGYGSSYDSGYGSSYDSGYGSSYDSGYGSSYDSGYGSTYDSGYGSTYDSGYGSTYDSGYGSTYDSGYGSTYDSGYGSSYDSGYGSTYDSGYGSSYDSGYGSTYNPSLGYNYYSGGNYYGNLGYNYYSGGVNNNSGYNDCNNCGYTPPCTTCDYTPPCTTCGYVPPVVIPNLVVSCTPNRTNINNDEVVVWTANASGGSGSYSYSWSGTDGLSGGGNQISKTYYSSGSKNAHVNVTSGGRTAYADCGTVYVNDNYHPYYPPNNYDLNISCNVNNANPSFGQNVIWNAYATGGNGSYYYSWTGTDGLYGNGSSISKVFNIIGTKYATVTVTSDGRTKSLTCPTVVVGSVGGLGYLPPNQGNLAGLTSVYLNQVPYTGVGDNPKFVAFILGLFMFSALGAYMIVSRKAKTERKNKILEFKHENMVKRGIK